jgi:spermidine/putrescine transport system substrate-binding protein
MNSERKFSRFFSYVSLILFQSLIASVSLLPTACTAVPTPEPTSTSIPLAEELVFYDWDEDMPQIVLDTFTSEYGVKIKYLVYKSQEEAIANMQSGEIYDVVVMESRFIPGLLREHLLAELRSENVSNLKNISPNFRELSYDPTNQFSVPYNWGTTGLVVRTDLVSPPVTRWTDLWNPNYANRVGIWIGQPREVISLTLKSLGYSANSEDLVELETAFRRLIALKSNILTLEEYDLYTSADLLASGKLVISMGYASDVITGSQQNSAIEYVLPDEGALLWNDTFVIPINSPNIYTAELFLNFLMRPEINAMIVNENLYATPNEAAHPFIEPEILNNPIIFPSNQDLANAELVLPLTPQGQRLYDSIWKRFLSLP